MIKTHYEESIYTIRLDNERKLNVLTTELIELLYEQVEHVNNRDDIKVCIITGGDKVFSAGVDINEFAAINEANIDNFLGPKWAAVADINVPVLAAVSGYALGGGFELALMCDMIIASKNAVFGLPEINLGLIPGNGGTQRLYKLIGRNKAFEFIAIGCKITALEAYNLNAVNRIATKHSAYSEALSIAKTIAQKSRDSLIATKCLMKENLNVNLDNERRKFRELLKTNEAKQAIHSFLK